MESGPKYAISKEGLIKFLVLLFGCTTFALLADSNSFQYPPAKTWAFAAFIISFSISFLFYFFHVIGLASRMNCGGSCTYAGFDFLWSWISTIHFFAASIAFAINITCQTCDRCKSCNEQVASVVLAFATVILYGVEAYFLRSYAPANVGYIATLRGWLKTSILVFGGAAFSLLVDSGYAWCTRGCYDAITYALAAYCIGWGVTVLIFFALMLTPKAKLDSKPFAMFQCGWSVLCVLLFLSASSCFAAYMNCNNSNFEYPPCNKRLAGVIAGFVAAVLYVVDAVLNRPK